MNFTIGALGTDVSFWQDNNNTVQKIDFAKMTAVGARFTILRAGQNTWRDEDYQDYVKAVKLVGLPWGAYWFFDSRSSPSSQVALWKSQMGASVPKVLVADFEESYGGSYRGEANWKAFLNQCGAAFSSSTIMIYTANWWWSQQVVGADAPQSDKWSLVNDPNFFAQYPLWVAAYPVPTNPAFVTLPMPWRNMQAHIWQFSDTGSGSLYGVESSRIDLNYWNSFYDFSLFWGSEPTPNPTPTPTGTKIRLTIKNETPAAITLQPGETHIVEGNL